MSGKCLVAVKVEQGAGKRCPHHPHHFGILHGIETDLELESGNPVIGLHRKRLVCHRLRRAMPAHVGHAGAGRIATQQAMARDPERLADDVVQGEIDRTLDRVVVGNTIQCPRGQFDGKRIEADQRRREPLFDRRDHRALRFTVKISP